MNNGTRWLLIALVLIAVCPTLSGQEAVSEENPAERVIRSHAAFLNELSDRRRLSTFFPNEQTALYGLPIRYVNSSRGNLTFVRRDLVTVGRIPVVFARAYDSSLPAERDFGRGWRLSLAETITRRSDGTLTYTDDSASQLELLRAGGGYALARPGPTNIASIEAEGEAIRVIHRDGWIKHFRPIGDRFVLVSILDPYGNTLHVRYRDAQVSRIEGQNGRFVAIERNGAGRVERITDDQGRSVSYAYDDQQRLEVVTDIGGNRWRYEYDGRNRLVRVIDPRNVIVVNVSFDRTSHVSRARFLGTEYQYKYNKGITVIRDATGGVTKISHDRFGMAKSVISPEGFVSELMHDPQYRLEALLHNGRPRAKVSYAPSGSLATLTRLDETGLADASFEFDNAGQLRRTTGADAGSVREDDSTSDRPSRRAAAQEVPKYEYTAQGDLRSVTTSAETSTYTHNADGQIETITSSHGVTTLGYFPSGKLASIQFANGALHKFFYNRLGFRERVERSDGSQSTYEYDVAGNLITAEGHKHTADGAADGQTFEINHDNQHEIIRFASGEVLTVRYDTSGNPERITSSNPEAPALEYSYDRANRLVAVQDGANISGSHAYERTEPDLRRQLDDRTMRVASGPVRQSASIGDLRSVIYTRPYGSILDVVRFDEATRTIDLASDMGQAAHDALTANSLARSQLQKIGASDAEAQTSFDMPSNVMFVPPEYETINCVPTGCEFTGVTVRGDGVSGTLTVPTGSTVTLHASKIIPSSCTLLICSWYVDNVFVAHNRLGETTYTFNSAGTHPVQAYCECNPCDMFRSGFLTVAVAAPVCARPVNFRQTAVTVLGGGNLQFDYRWDSSTGNRNDLASCDVGEIVEYPGTGPGFFYPSPPFPANPANGVLDPTIVTFSAETGAAVDIQWVPGIGNFVKPYSASSVTSVQNWRYRCPCANGGAWVNVLGPLNVVRSVSQNTNGSWKYTVTKPTNGQASINPLP